MKAATVANVASKVFAFLGGELLNLWGGAGARRSAHIPIWSLDAGHAGIAMGEEYLLDSFWCANDGAGVKPLGIMQIEIVTVSTNDLPNSIQKLMVLDPQDARVRLTTLHNGGFSLISTVASTALVNEGASRLEIPVLVYTLSRP